MRTLKKHCIIKMLSYNILIILLTSSLVACIVPKDGFNARYWVIYIAGHGLRYQPGFGSPNLMVTLYCTETVPIIQTQILIWI